MSSIGQGPTQTDQANAPGSIVNQPVDYSDQPVKRGYSNQNSYSRAQTEETVQSQAPKPRLDNPKAGADSDAAGQEVLRGFQKSQEKPVSDFLREDVKQELKKGLEEGVKQAEKQAGELSGEKKANSGNGNDAATLQSKTKKGSPTSGTETPGKNSGATPGAGETSSPNTAARTASPNGPDATSNVQDIDLPSVEEFDRFAAAFEDVYVKLGAVKEAPPGLLKEIQAEYAKFTQQALSGKQPLDVDGATTMLMSIQSKLQDNRIKFDQETIKIRQVEYDQQFRESIGKIRGSIADAQKAKVSGIIGKIFGWIAVAVMVIVTVIVAVVGAIFAGGTLTAVAVSLMVAALAIVLTMQISSEAGSTWMMDMFGDSKEAKIGAMVFWTALIIALSIGGAVAGGFAGAGAGAGGAAASGAANAASTGASAGATATATAANTAATASSLTAKVTSALTTINKVLQVISGAAMIGDGSSQIATSAYNYNAEIARAEAMENRAFMLRLKQAIDDATESIAQAIEELQAGYQVAASIIKADHETKTNLLSKLKA